MGSKKTLHDSKSQVKVAEKISEMAVKSPVAVTMTPPAAPVAVTTAPAAVKAPAAATAVVTPVAAAVATPVAVTSAVATPVVAVAATPVRDRSSIVALIARLRDQDAEVARDAATNLGNLPVDAEAVTALCTTVVNADGYFHSVVRAAAATALGKLGDRHAVDALIRGTGDAMAEASEEAIKALGLLSDARAIPVLEAVIRNETGFFLENVRRTATAALAKIRTAAK